MDNATTNETNTDLRQERGRILSNDRRIKHIAGPTWLVPSQTQPTGGYVVNTAEKTCTCPDHELRRCRCKHQWAVSFVQTVETDGAGNTTVTQSLSYSRTSNFGKDWNAYNAAQTTEKDTVQALLRGLCDGLKTPAHPGRGPKPIPLSDVVFAMVAKTYSLMSARRATTDIEASAEAGNMSRAPHYNSTLAAFSKPEMTDILTKLIERSAAPLAGIESSFAVDSTGFGTCTYTRWYDEKYGRPMKKATWVKAHACVGTTTGVVTSVKVTTSEGADCPQLPQLVDATKSAFQMAEVSADKAYLSNENLTAIESTGAQPFVPFKLNSQQDGSPAWRKMHAVFVLKQDEFLAAYAKRNNVESTFSAMKRKFGGSVRSKQFTAQVNEVLCKVLAYNLSCLVHAMHALGIEPSFLGKAVA
jgi:transposase